MKLFLSLSLNQAAHNKHSAAWGEVFTEFFLWRFLFVKVSFQIGGDSGSAGGKEEEEEESVRPQQNVIRIKIHTAEQFGNQSIERLRND